jgi:hypothetical protein
LNKPKTPGVIPGLGKQNIEKFTLEIETKF